MEFRRDAQVGRAGDRVTAVPPEDLNLRGGTRDVIAVVEAVGDDVLAPERVTDLESVPFDHGPTGETDASGAVDLHVVMP